MGSNCVVCGVVGEHHHIIYRSQGGGDGADNLLCLCRSHHSDIHRSLIDFMNNHGGLLEYRLKGDDRLSKLKSMAEERIDKLGKWK